MKRAFIMLGCIAILSGVLLACGASSDGNTGSVVGTSTAAPTVAPAKHFTSGQVVKVGDWQVTLNGAKTNPGDDFMKPKAGNTFVVVDVSLKNVSAQAQPISSGLNFSLKDSTGQKYTETILTGETPPDGSINAGDTLRGQLTYEIPTTQHKLTFSFQGDITSTDQTVWDISI